MITDEDVAAPIRAQDGAAPAAVLQDDPDLARMRFGEPPDGRDAASALQDVAIGGGLLSFLTFGLYRFWMKTWRRQVVWRETRIGGEGFEYTGEPYELMLGSMLAVTVLSLLIGTANMAATYLQISLAAGFQAALFVSVPLLLPIGQWAIYRARRYRLLRSKWRGVRAGMDGSGWRYLGVWALWTVIEIASLWFLRPYKLFALERYKTNHTLYGDARFRFEGGAGRVMGRWAAFWLIGGPVMALLIGFSLLGVLAQMVNDDPLAQREAVATAIMTAISWLHEIFGERMTTMALEYREALRSAMILCAILALPVWFWYRAGYTRAIIEARRICDVRFVCGVRGRDYGAAFAAMIGRSFLGGVVLAIVIVVLVWLTMTLAAFIDGVRQSGLVLLQMGPAGFESPVAKALALLAIWINYGLSLVFYGWLAGVVYFRRIHGRICAATVVSGLSSLDAVRQRAGARQVESEGFADALDVGGL